MNNLVLVLASSGFGAIAAAIVTGIFSKKKLGAEATKIITDAAAGVVQTLNAEVLRLQTRVTEVTDKAEKDIRAMAQAHVSERNEWRRVLQLHVAWDSIAIAEVSKMGVDLPPAPPLLPAERFVDEQGFPVD